MAVAASEADLAAPALIPPTSGVKKKRKGKKGKGRFAIGKGKKLSKKLSKKIGKRSGKRAGRY